MGPGRDLPSVHTRLVWVIFLASCAIASSALPAPGWKWRTSSSASAPATTPTVPPASENSNNALWSNDDPPADPEPIRGKLGATILAQQNIAIDQQNPDLLAPPTTDRGELYVPLFLELYVLCLVKHGR